LEGVEQQKIPNKNRNAFSDALLLARFQNFAAGAAKKKLGFIDELIIEVIRGQKF